jgi:hypothetical protein
MTHVARGRPCALKAGAQSIYTWNVKHFNRLGESIAARVRQP